MTNSHQTPPASEIPRVGMYRELLAIHQHLRRDLATVRRLADEVRAGLSPATILDEIRNLETTSPLWRLRFGCMHYCRVLHMHHTIEDAAVFPMVRRADPALHPVVDRLEEDHLRVHHLTEAIAAAADLVPGDATGIARIDLAHHLEALETHLLEHLAYEERTLGPLLSTWDRWPGA